MSNSRKHPPNAVSPWWALLLLPAGLLVGWAIGEMPTGSTAPPAARAGSASVPAGLAPPPEAPAARAPGRGSWESDPAPAAGESPAAVESRWTDFASALEESRRTGKPVMLDFNADWCPPCQLMKRQVFDAAPHARAVQTAVIPVSIVDRYRETGANSPEVESLQRQFRVDAFPTLVVFSPATGRSVASRGYGGAAATVAWIEQAASQVR
jgi:thiol-disulfide isomerase/thioredoxin